MARWQLRITPQAWRLRIKSWASRREPPSSPYETAVERFARRHPRIALTLAVAAFGAGAVGALVELVEHWSLPRSPFVALFTGASAAMLSAAGLVRLRRDGFAAPIPILVVSWLPPVLAAAAALQPESAGGWVLVAGYGFLAVYLAGCAALLGFAARIGRHEEQLRRSLFRERRRAILRAMRRRPARHPRRMPKPGGARPSS